jgi:hypothetical protein
MELLRFKREHCPKIEKHFRNSTYGEIFRLIHKHGGGDLEFEVCGDGGKTDGGKDDGDGKDDGNGKDDGLTRDDIKIIIKVENPKTWDIVEYTTVYDKRSVHFFIKYCRDNGLCDIFI